MSTLVVLVRNDALLLWRRGVMAASLVVVAGYVIVLQMLSSGAAATTLPFLVFSDPAALGFFFVGGVALSERSEGTAAAVTVTPIGPGELTTARTAGLAGLGTAGAILIAAFSGVTVGWPIFVAATALTAIAYTLLGLAVAMRSTSVNEYFARATVVSIPLFGPLAAALAFPEAVWLQLWPPTASLGLLRASVEGSPGPGRQVLAFVVLGATCLAAAAWARYELVAATRSGRI